MMTFEGVPSGASGVLGFTRGAGPQTPSHGCGRGAGTLTLILVKRPARKAAGGLSSEEDVAKPVGK